MTDAAPPAGPAPGPEEINARFQRAHRRMRTAAVTGTNGKTTTTSMIEAIVAASGEPSARLTTIGGWVGAEPIEAATPTEQFLALVERAVEAGVRTLALEVTSKALAAGLAKRWRPTVAVFTNLTRDHLDMHGTPEAYLASKAQLFMALPPGGCAVLNADDGSSALIREVIPPGVSVRGFSVRQPKVTLAATKVTCTARGTAIELAPSPLADALGGRLDLAVTGAVHAQNALAAVLAADALGYKPDAIARGLGTFAGAPGRFQIVGTAPLTTVDYAHTPDGLDGTLQTAREIVATAGRGRVICVFGCGGDRDRTKRAPMGEAAGAGSDFVIVTSDNPRSEDPQQIIADAEVGLRSAGRQYLAIADRRDAIFRAIDEAAPGDIVVIAGKGHEDYQIFADRTIHFDDREVAREALEARGLGMGAIR